MSPVVKNNIKTKKKDGLENEQTKFPLESTAAVVEAIQLKTERQESETTKAKVISFEESSKACLDDSNKSTEEKPTVEEIAVIDTEKNKLLGDSKTPIEHTAWVGGINFKTDEATLKHFFSSCGPITRVVFPYRSGKNKGIARVVFETEESLEKAIALSNQELDGRKLFIKKDKNFKRDGAKPSLSNPIPGESDMEASPSLFIGYLSFSTTEDWLRKKFSKFGKIKNVQLATFEDSGRCKGFAWIRFKSQHAATQALRSSQYIYIDGRPIEVKYARPNSSKRDSNLSQDHPSSKKLKALGKNSQ